ncbi:hypothetical protein FUAX_06140 [Fulvitalea axinellae]|uniref:Uncharacterized protein n=1 Tax=Fulvitalea axinellae TaxID=1182444 RepID=A0AAU9CS57_9BACT|nr:hypothetical protein FUAX_06140 [Fulvitalea axinellae]
MALALTHCIFLIFSHAFHVSVTDLSWNRESGRIEISTRVFIDDLEDAISKNREKKPDLLNNFESEGENIGRYISAHLSLKAKSKMLDLEYVGAEVEGDALWIYMQSQKVRKPKDLEVTNKVLMELFSDQQNIVHYTYEGQRKSLKLDKDQASGQFTF